MTISLTDSLCDFGFGYCGYTGFDGPKGTTLPIAQKACGSPAKVQF
jgi:hypothetical protein